MSPTAVLLLIVSAVLHASWNLLSKRRHPSASYFLLANIVGGILLLPVVAPHADALAGVPARVWTLLTVTGAFMALYYAALAGAYRSGHISVAYPLARSSPVIVVTFVTVALGRGDQVSAQCGLGIVAVVAGCFLIPMARFSDLRLSNYLNRTCGLALLAAVGTAGYSMADDEALRLLRHAPALAHLGTVRVTLTYSLLESISSSLWLLLFVLASPEERRSAGALLRQGKRQFALAGAMIYLTYTIVLVSLAFVSNISYVVAFRQLSIPLGALMGIAILHEPAHRPKLVGVAVMFAGLVLVGTG